MYEHKHTHKANTQLIARISKIVGHTSSIKTMIEEERDCSEILIQIAAVRSALNSVGKLLLDEHIHHCVLEALQSDAPDKNEILDELSSAIDKFVR